MPKPIKGNDNAIRERIPYKTKVVAGIKIEKNIAISKIIKHRNTDTIDVLRALEIGDSFVVSKNKAMNYFACVNRNRLDIKLITRKINETQCRVWRIE